MIRRHAIAFRLALMAADAVTAMLLFAVTSALRFGPSWPGVWRTAGLDPALAMAAYGSTWMTLLWILGMYRLRSRWSAASELMDVGRAALLLALTTFSVLFVVKLPDVSRLLLLQLFTAQVVITIASRSVIRALMRTLRNQGRSARFMLVVGTGPAAVRFANRIERHRELGLRIIGHLAEDGSTSGTVAGRPVLGTIDDIEGVINERVMDEVAICLPATSIGMVEPITRLCAEIGKVVRMPLDEYNVTLPGGRVEEFDGIPVMSLVYGPDRALGLLIKRTLDVGFGGLALLALSPLLLVVTLWILVADGRPILFRQVRVGTHGREFRVVKFRTMVPDAENRLAELEGLNEIKGHAFKVTADPRLTRTGRMLRATSIDELPQLWNVLLGEMSIVGPRPPLPREVEGYDLWHRRRLSMKPGITGLWQVEARREADFDKWVELDLAYIDRWSIWLDFKIILRTIPAMLQGR